MWWWWIGCVGPWPGNTLIVDPIMGFLYPGPAKDEGWSQSQDAGRDYAHKQLHLPTAYRQGVEPYNASTALLELLDENSNVIFTTRYDYASATQQAATDNPERLFFSCGGGVTGPNLASYGSRTYQATYLAGRLAASVSCTKRLGVVASIPIPEVVRNINAFTLGAREIDPDVVVEARFIGEWADEAEEALVVDSMIGRNVDVLTHQTDSLATVGHAAGLTTDCEGVQSPVYTIAQGLPEGCGLQPNCLTSSVWNWGPLYVDLLTQVTEGTLDTSVIRLGGFESDPSKSLLGFSSPGEDVDDSDWDDLLEKRDALAEPANSRLPFVGPFQDNQGDARAGQGETLADEALERMCWFVEGVVSGYNGTDPAVVPEGCNGEY